MSDDTSPASHDEQHGGNDFPPLVELVPHRPPMLMLDRVLRFSGPEVECEAQLLPDGVFVQAGGVGMLIAIELIAQASAVWLGLRAREVGDPVTRGYLVGSPQLEFAADRLPVGQPLRICATHVWGEDRMMSFDGAVWLGGTRLAAGTLNVIKAASDER